MTTGVLAQLVSPFVRRDDWPFLLPRHAPGANDPIDKARQEGRWLSYGWWWLVGQHGTGPWQVSVFQPDEPDSTVSSRKGWPWARTRTSD